MRWTASASAAPVTIVNANYAAAHIRVTATQRLRQWFLDLTGSDAPGPSGTALRIF